MSKYQRLHIDRFNVNCQKNYKISDEILYLIFDYPHKHYTFKHFEI